MTDIWRGNCWQCNLYTTTVLLEVTLKLFLRQAKWNICSIGWICWISLRQMTQLLLKSFVSLLQPSQTKFAPWMFMGQIPNKTKQTNYQLWSKFRFCSAPLDNVYADSRRGGNLLLLWYDHNFPHYHHSLKDVDFFLFCFWEIHLKSLLHKKPSQQLCFSRSSGKGKHGKTTGGDSSHVGCSPSCLSGGANGFNLG